MTWRIFVKNLIYPGTLWGPLFPLKLAKFRRGVFSSFFQLSRSSFTAKRPDSHGTSGTKVLVKLFRKFFDESSLNFFRVPQANKILKNDHSYKCFKLVKRLPESSEVFEMLLREKWKKNKKPKIKFLAPPQCQFDIRMSKLFHLSEFRISFERIWLPGVDIVGVGIVEFEISIKMLALGGWKAPSAQLVISGTNI